MKNENGQEKSAILKGNTLVNIYDYSISTFIGGATIENGVITFKPNGGWVVINNKLPMLKPNTNYTIFVNILSNTLNYPSTELDYALRVEGDTGNSGFITGFDIPKGSDGIFKKLLTTKESLSTTNLSDVRVSASANGGEIKFTYMIIEGDHTQEDIPYFEGMQSVQMPSLTTTGKNLWDNKIFENCPIATINNDGSLTLNGTLNHHWMFKYTIDKGIYSSSAIGNDNGYIHMFWGGGDGYFQANEPFNIAERITRDGYIAQGTYDNINIKLQLEQGSTTTSYEPFKSNILTVNEDVTLRGIGDVQDTLDCLTGEVVECIGEVVLDGSENWNYHENLSTDALAVFSVYNNFGYLEWLGAGSILCDKFPVTQNRPNANNAQEGIYDKDGWAGKNKIPLIINKDRLSSVSVDGLKLWLSNNQLKLQFKLQNKSIKTVVLNIKDQDNQPQERMKLFPSGYINTSSSTISPILELKGITHNNKLNMTTTNGTNNTQLTTLDNLALDGIICRDGTVVRDSYDVESGLYTKRVFRFTIDEEFIERYKNHFVLNENKATTYSMRIGIVIKCGFPKIYQVNKYCTSNIAMDGTDRNSASVGYDNFYIQILKEELSSYDVNGILEWVKRNGAIEMAYAIDIPQIIHMQPNMTPYVSTRPYQGSIESQGNILESSFLDYTSEQSIISPKPLGDGDVLRWEQGSQCYVYENDKEYIPLTDYNQPMGTVLDLEEEDGEQFVENLDGGDIIVDVPFKEKAVYERHLVSHEDNVIYPTQDKLDPTGKIEVDYICGETWQNPNDLSDIRHVGTLREDGQYDVTIRRSGDDEIRLMDGTTNISLDYDGTPPSEFELTFFNSGGVEVGKYGDTSHTLEDCVLDSKLETGMVYGDTMINLIDFKANSYQVTGSVTSRGVNTITFKTNDVGKFNIVCTVDLKPSTKYCIKANIQSTNSVTFRVLDVKANQYKINETILANGEYIGTFTASSNATTGQVTFYRGTTVGEETITGTVTLIEYIDGCENWLEHFEGIGSTVVNGFTVSNSDDTEMVQYTLPLPITLNKVGDVADTYDVVSGVETRNVTELTFNGGENWDAIFNSSLSVFQLTLPSIKANSPLLIKNGLVDGIISIAFENNVLTIITTANFASVSVINFKNKLKNNPITIYAQLANQQTIQHTLIPSTVETMQEPTFILPQPLRSVPNGICDRLYWDENKGHYCIEKRIEEVYIDGSQTYSQRNGGDSSTTITYESQVKNQPLFTIEKGYSYPMPCSQGSRDGIEGWGVDNEKSRVFLEIKRDRLSEVSTKGFTQWISENHQTVIYVQNTSEIIDLSHLNKKLTLPTQPDTLPIGYKVEHPKANPQLGLTIPYKQLNYPSRPQNIDFKMDIADYVLTWDDVKEARQYNIILNDRTIATVKEPQWNSGEEMYGYIMVEAQNELAENLSEELYIKTVPNAPAQLTVAHNPMTNYYDFEISFIKTSAIAEYYTVQYRIDGGEWVYKTIQSDEIDPNTKVLWNFSIYEINEQIEVWATATNDIGTNDILPIATYYMSPTPQWTYRINSKELFVRWMDDSPYDTQYKLRYQYKSDGIYRYAYFEGDKQEIGKLYEALIPLADDEEVSIALCVISEKENLYTKPIKASKELDPNIKPPKNFNYHWLARGLIEFYWEDNYDVDVEYEAIVEHRLTSGNNEWITDTRIFSATDTEGTGTVYRLSYQMEDLEEIRVKVRMKWAMNETEWSESLTTVFIPVEGNPPTWIRRTQTQEGLLVEWEAQEYVDSYHVYVMSNGEELQHLETMDNFIYVDLDYSNPIDIEIYEATRFSGGIQSDPSEKMCFRPTMDKHQLIHDVVTPDTLTYEIEVDTIQKGIKERQVIHDINTTPKVTSKQPMDVSISSPFTLSFHPLQLDVHQAGSKYYGNTELHIKTLDVKSRDAIEVLTFERITDQYGVDFTVYTPSASKYPITLEVNRVRIVCFGDSLTSGGKYYQIGNMDNRLVG